MTPETRKPLVSIGLPVYNGGDLTRRALDSLLAQDYATFELIISDNASTDGTWDILQEYAARDARIRLYRNACNEGAAFNFNRVYDLSTGEYFMWAAHDDWWEPAFISTCVAYFMKHPEVAACYPGELVFSAGGALEIDHEEVWRRVYSLLRTWPAPAVAVYGLFRRAALRPALPPLNVEGPDSVILMHTALAGPIAFLPSALHHYTRGPRTIRQRLQQMGRKISIFSIWIWDFRLLWVMFRLSQPVAPDFRARWLLLRALGGFFSRVTTWPYPVAMAKRYSSLLSDSTYDGIISWLARRPRLAAVLRRLTGLNLRPFRSGELSQPLNGAPGVNQEHDV
jgi:glycosyltransferase involved in cell wall biosynthesis